MNKIKVAIIGSGNIGTDLMIKIMRLSDVLEMGCFVGVDPGSDGLKRAERLGVPITSDGIDGLVALPGFDEIKIVFDATSAGAHEKHDRILREHGKIVIDLTPAAIGPFTIPAVNGLANLDEPNVNMVTCGGQATIPIVAAISAVTPVHYGEIVASIASKSAGPGTRANIDEFTETTSSAIEEVGGAARGKAIIILNPAEPPMIMRDTVQVLTSRLDEPTREAVVRAVVDQVAAVAGYVPGYRLKQQVQFLDHGPEFDTLVPADRVQPDGYTRVTVFLEVEGAAMYLPSYAGNLDIMTSAALRAAERIVVSAREKEAVA